MTLEPVAAIALPTLVLSDEERSLINYHLHRLGAFRVKNAIKIAYYEGKQRLANLGISVPPELRNVETVVGWPGTTVDVLEERLDFYGWGEDGTALGLDEVYTMNGLDVDASLGHLDALITGTGFVIVGSGYADEPHPLITVESANKVTGQWDGRQRRLSSALSIDAEENGRVTEVTLYLPNENITVDTTMATGDYRIVDREDRDGRDQHNAGRVLVARMVNRTTASAADGRSEISPAIRSYTDQGVRTLLGMDVHREFFQAPQRYALGVDAEAFTDKDGHVKTGWEAIMGRMLALPRDEDGELPQVGQFSQSSPAPYLEQVRGLAQLVSAEAAIPSNYLGFTSDNPPSADAIRAMEARLIKRAERRQAVFGRTWREVAYLALLVRDGRVPDEFRNVRAKWRDAATPTRAAAADEATKLVAAGILPADSTVTYDRIGLTPEEQRTITRDKRRARALETIRALSQPPAPAQPPQQEEVTDDEQE